MNKSVNIKNSIVHSNLHQETDE